MVYSSAKNPNQPKRRRRRRKRRPKDAFDYARQAYNYAKSLRKYMGNIEFKENVKTAAGTSISDNATVVNLSLLAQGTDKTDRIGNSIRYKSLLGRFHSIRHDSATATAIRFIIFIDFQMNGTAPTATALLNTENYQSSLNTNFGKRFRVICDETLVLSSGSARSEMIKCYRKLDYHMEFQGTSATAANQASGALFLLMISNEPTNTPTVDYNIKTRFIDN